MCFMGTHFIMYFCFTGHCFLLMDLILGIFSAFTMEIARRELLLLFLFCMNRFCQKLLVFRNTTMLIEEDLWIEYNQFQWKKKRKRQYFSLWYSWCEEYYWHGLSCLHTRGEDHMETLKISEYLRFQNIYRWVRSATACWPRGKCHTTLGIGIHIHILQSLENFLKWNWLHFHS